MRAAGIGPAVRFLQRWSPRRLGPADRVRLALKAPPQILPEPHYSGLISDSLAFWRSLEPCNRLLIHSGRSLVGLHTFEGLPDHPFGDVERLCLAHRLLPLPVGPWARLNKSFTSVHLHY